MKIKKSAPHDKFSGTIPEYLYEKLSYQNEPGTNPTFKCVIRMMEKTNRRALGRLCEVLAEKDILTAQDIRYIAEDFRGEYHQIKFIKG